MLRTTNFSTLTNYAKQLNRYEQSKTDFTMVHRGCTQIED
jgi:hypothetical protein